MKKQEAQLPDWQLGEKSNTSPLERIELMSEWLLQNKLSILNSSKSTTINETEMVGFIDD